MKQVQIELVSLADTAKLTRAALVKAFSEIKFTVRRKPTVFGDCIGISWGISWLTTSERMPDTGPMREIAKRYCNHHDSEGGFDRLHWLFPDGSSKFAMLVDRGRRSDSVMISERDIPEGARLVLFASNRIEISLYYDPIAGIAPDRFQRMVSNRRPKPVEKPSRLASK